MPRKARPLAARLEQNTEQMGECLVWTGTVSDGYGKLWFDGKMRSVARVAYELYVGPVPDELGITASCGNKLCIAKAHLTPLTRAAATELGFKRACRQPQAASDYKLHLWEREAITEQVDAGVAVAELARTHGVCPKTIRRVRSQGQRRQAEAAGRAVTTNRAFPPCCVLCREEFADTSPEREQHFHQRCRANPAYAEVLANKQLMRILIADERANRQGRTAQAESADALLDRDLL